MNNNDYNLHTLITKLFSDGRLKTQKALIRKKGKADGLLIFSSLNCMSLQSTHCENSIFNYFRRVLKFPPERGQEKKRAVF